MAGRMTVAPSSTTTSTRDSNAANATTTAQPEFDEGFNPCSLMTLEEGVTFVSITEMMIYTAGALGMGVQLAFEDSSTPPAPGLAYLIDFIVYLVVGLTFPLLYIGASKRKRILCFPSCIGLVVAFILRIVALAMRPTDGLVILSFVLSLCEIYYFIIIIAYIKDCKLRPDGPPIIPDLFGEPLAPDAESPYIVQILSTDASAASVRKNPRFQNGFP